MEIIDILNENYGLHFDKIQKLRDGGNKSYAVFSGTEKYFLRVIRPAFFKTAFNGINVQRFLQNEGFPVPAVIRANNGTPYIQTENELFVLYEFISGTDSQAETDAEEAGVLIGELHRIMRNYTDELALCGKDFYIGRYINILREKQYKKTAEFEKLGDDLWERIKDLPRGFCHGDMYDGNILKTQKGSLYALDFDTACKEFPMYDLTLYCNRTNYFDYEKSGKEKSKKTLDRFLTGYTKKQTVSSAEINAFFDFISVYHFAVQATIIEIHGPNCIDNNSSTGCTNGKINA